MLRNYLKVAVRNLLRYKTFTITNLLGLSLGITCAILIFLWVKDEVDYDKFYKNYERIHVVVANRDFKNKIFTNFNMVLPLAQALENKNPQVERTVVTTQGSLELITYGETKLKKVGLSASKDFFNIFSFRFLKGSSSTALSDASQIVLTESTAEALFGTEDPIGKILRIDNTDDVKVSAVIADPPGNSTLQFDYLQPFNYSSEFIQRMMANWTNSTCRVYVLTTPGANMEQVDQFIHQTKIQHSPNDQVSTYFTFPMKKMAVIQ